MANPSIIQSKPSGLVNDASGSFEDRALAVLDELRLALGEFTAAIPGSASRAVDLERQLEIDKKLAWRLFRLVRSSGLEEAANVPGRPAMRRLLKAAEHVGADSRIIKRIADASERFERFAQAHGGNREEVISLMVRLAGEGSDPYELKTRKAYFRSAAHIWGVQARLQARTMIHHWAPESGEYDGVLVGGDVGLQRRDPSRPLVVSARLQADGETANQTSSNGEGNHPEAPRGPELLTDFCSQPLPEMVLRSRGEAHVETEIIFPVSGRNGTVTLYTCRSVKGNENRPHTVSAQMFVAMPTEEVVCDLVLDAGWTDPASARVAVYGCRHRPEHVSEQRPSDLFPQRETVTYLGEMETVAPVAGAPQHQKAVQEVLQRNGWLGRRFDVYRCRVQYPVLHTQIVLRVDARAT